MSALRRFFGGQARNPVLVISATTAVVVAALVTGTSLTAHHGPTHNVAVVTTTTLGVPSPTTTSNLGSASTTTVISRVTVGATSTTPARKVAPTTHSSVTSPPAPVAPSYNLYIGNAQVEVPAGDSADTITPAILFYGSNGGLLAEVDGQTSNAEPGVFAPIAPVVATAPTGSVVANLVVNTTTGSSPVMIQDSNLAKSHTGQPGAVDGPVSQSGNRLVQANGDPIIFAGVNVTQLDGAAPQGLTANQVAQIHSWGVNMVRLQVSEADWGDDDCEAVPNYQGEVQNAISEITGYGIEVLISLASVEPTGCQEQGHAPMADANSVNFWEQVATIYGSNPLVAFDLYNEPAKLTDAIWLNGGQEDWKALPYNAVGMQALYNAVRSVGANNLIVLAGNVYATQVPAELVDGTNIAYSVHSYTCPNDPPPSCTQSGNTYSQTPYDPDTILSNFNQVALSYPIINTEFGWPAQNSGTYINNDIAYDQGRGWSWTVFFWLNPGTSVSEYSVVAKETTALYPEPSPSGMPALEALAGQRLEPYGMETGQP